MNSILTPIRRRMVILFIIVLGLTEVVRRVYRPYIYRNEINDLGIADSSVNFFGALSIMFLAVAVSRITVRNSGIIISVVVSGLILLEVVQLHLAPASFDWKDIFATLLSGVVALLTVRRMMPRDGETKITP